VDDSPGERSLGGLLPQDSELLWIKLLTPLCFGFSDFLYHCDYSFNYYLDYGI
jgi:hypothetical protein